MSFSWDSFYLSGYNTGADFSGIQKTTPLYWIITGLKYNGNTITPANYWCFTGISIAGSGDLTAQSGIFGWDADNDYWTSVMNFPTSSKYATGIIELYWNSGASVSTGFTLESGFIVTVNNNEESWNKVSSADGVVNTADTEHTHLGLAPGGATQLDMLTDVAVDAAIAYTDGKVIRADGNSYEESYLNIADIPNLAEWSGDMITLSGVVAEISGDFSLVSGDYVITSGDYVSLSGDYLSVSGIFASFFADYDGTSGDYVITSGDYVITSGDYVNFSGSFASMAGEFVTHVTGLTGDEWSVYYSSGIHATGLPLGTSGQALMSNGPGVPPVWGTPSTVGGLADLDDVDDALSGVIVSLNDTGSTSVSGVTEGQLWWDEGSEAMYRWNTGIGAWIQLGGGNSRQELPTGMVIMYDGSGIADADTRTGDIGSHLSDAVAMAGWYVCNGQSNTPNLLDRFIRASGIAGETGGADTHTLTIAEMPSHYHTYRGYRDSAQAVGGTYGYNQGYQDRNTSTVGGGDAHNNMPAYYSLIYIKRME